MSVTARFRSIGSSITFDSTKTLGKGGEGSVYAIPNQPSVVAKVLHPGKATQEKCAKIELMVANPPHNPMQSKGHTSIAWPTEILEYGGTSAAGLVNGQVIGFIMPRIGGSMRIIMSFYDRVIRLNDFPWFTYGHLLNIGRNFVNAVRAIHEKGYVIGDVNESNIMVGEDTYVTIIDTDSFQVTDPSSGTVYRCTVGKEDFTAPELQGMRFSDVDRSIASDLFGIGVILFQLLMENTHPFAGIYTGSGNPPELRERIRQGFFTYSTRKSVPFKPVPLAPPFELLSPYLRNLFIRCFEDGHSNPGLRPTAKEWMDALTLAKDSLTRCSKNDQHYHGTHSPSCPWCESKNKLGIDSFGVTE
jgi:DNA-binding helix-hairpin-helix protein with protein kinase domain